MTAKRKQSRKNSAPEVVLDTTASPESLEERKTSLIRESQEVSGRLRDAEEIIRIGVSAELRIAAIRNGKRGCSGEESVVAAAVSTDSECRQLKKRLYEIDTLLLQNEIERQCAELRERVQHQQDWDETA